MDVPVLDMKGAEVGSMKVDERLLGGDVNPVLIKQAFVRYHANRRVGSSITKNRHEVEGSTRKLYKQKGTGRARHGDKKVPQFRGGGHGHSKKKTREDFRLDMPKKMRRKANRNALLAKLVDGEVKIIDDIRFDRPRTKDFAEFLSAIGASRSALVALSSDNTNARLSGRNIPDVSLCRVQDLNAFDMLNSRFLVVSKKDLQAWLAGPSSQTGKEAKLNPMGRASGEEAA